MTEASDLPVLTAEEQRVLGSLLEKEVTVPASYPLTLNALRTACNQSSSREPITDLDEQVVESTARGLKDRGLVRIVWSESGRRTLKYHQTLAERLGLAPDERALLTVLLLRGAQAPGALRARTERLHPFADKEAVEACLVRMSETYPPLVAQQPRRPREQDHRWVHLLGPVDDATPAAHATPAADDRDGVLADGPEARDAKVRASYATVAAPYAERLVTELHGLPFERWLLDRVAAEPGPVVEVGCGPGHVTAYLVDAGADATGLDLTPEMVEQARRVFPDVTYEVGDLRRLMRPATADGWGAVLAWYSLIHLAPAELPAALEALVRPIRPGGLLVLALHAGRTVRHVTSWFEQEIDLEFVLYPPDEVVGLLERAGLTDVEWYQRGPVAALGESSERLYVLARKPA